MPVRLSRNLGASQGKLRRHVPPHRVEEIVEGPEESIDKEFALSVQATAVQLVQRRHHDALARGQGLRQLQVVPMQLRSDEEGLERGGRAVLHSVV